MRIKTTSPFCSIVVLNYFGEKVIKKAIFSLENLSYPKNSYEIIIVDNGSKDKSRNIIKISLKKYKNIRTKYLNKNSGFSAGNNVGIRMAKGEYVILLNNDCTTDKEWLTELVKTAEKDKKIFAVNSKIILHGTAKIQNAGIMVFQDGYGRDIGAVVKHQLQDYEKDKGQYNKEKEIYAACGAAVLYRKEILDKIGLLDENFFMYYEDVELSERARLHNYKICYCPKAIAYHHHALSSTEWSPFFIYHTEKGRLLHIFYHFPVNVVVHEFFYFALAAFLRFFKEIFFLKNYRKNLQYFKVVLYFLINFPQLLLMRNKKQGLIPKEEVDNNYSRILNGYWYFN